MIEKEMHPLTDPRGKPGFQPAFFPLSDSSELPAGEMSNRNDRIRLTFLSIYYEINVVAASLTSEGISSEEEARLKQDLTSLRKSRDELEDFYTPCGVLAEATLVEGFAANINFTFPNESRWFQQRQAGGSREAELRFSAPKPDVRNK